jgi:class 3 adenylate cyclase
MPVPRTCELTQEYFYRQKARTLETLRRIVSRDPVTAVRVIPTAEDLAIHDGRRLEEATVMFLDISKFSIRPAWTDAEQQVLLQILSLFFTEMIHIVEDYGGVVEKNTGDGLMAYFVRRTEDTISVQQRALSTALTMFTAADKLINPILLQSNLEPINFRICLNHGPITIAKVGAARGFNGIVAIGTTANIASKMLGFADPNTILIGAKFYAGLPITWTSQFAKFKTQDTGWIYLADRTAYSFWVYTGRWIGNFT